jgi:hypothetical protein
MLKVKYDEEWSDDLLASNFNPAMDRSGELPLAPSPLANLRAPPSVFTMNPFQEST